MSDLIVAARYAKSLFDLSIERNSLEEVSNDLQMIGSLINGNKELKLLLKNPVVPHLKKLAIFKELFEGKVNVLTMSLLEITTKKNRESVIPSMVTEFHKLYNDHLGIQKAIVTTTYELTAEQRSEFIEMVKKISNKKSIELVEKIDESIIGGFVLRVDDEQLDDSINTKLKSLRQKFSQNPYVKEF
jgi:F-type H+-transporting ATPase subunit delta